MDLFTLAAKLTMDTSEYKKGISESQNIATKFASSLSTKTVAIGKMIGNFATKAVSSVASATKGILKDSISAYADCEQLVGGVETLFGTGGRSFEEWAEQTGKTGEKAVAEYNRMMEAQNLVLENADTAYFKAGLSANEYMETVTSFSAALISSLRGDTLDAASVADMAIQDMADNANKMGTDMSAIQAAYQGFAKQNYTLLDNLKLGYGGTKTEMERLLKDAMKLTGRKYNLNSLADIYEAIHVIQTEMDITGTTAKEAENTISGSINMAKAAWTNLLTALGDPEADVSEAVDEFAYSVDRVVHNVLPVFKRTLKGAFDAANAGVNNFITTLKESNDPMLQNIGYSLEGVVSRVREIKRLFTNFPEVVQELKNSDSEVLQLLGSSLEKIPTAIETISRLVSDFDGTVEALKSSDSEILVDIGNSLQFLKDALSWIVENKDAVVTALGAVIGFFGATKFAGLISAHPVLAALVVTLTAIATNWEDIVGWVSAAQDKLDAVVSQIEHFFGLDNKNKSGKLDQNQIKNLESMWLPDVIGDDQNLQSGFAYTLGTALSNVGFSAEEIANVINNIDWSKSKEEVENWLASLTSAQTEADELGSALDGVAGDYNANVYINTFGETPDVSGSFGGGQSDGNGAGRSFGHAKGLWNVPYDDYPALLHRGETVLNASRARDYRDGNSGSVDMSALASIVESAIRAGMQGAVVNSYLNGKNITDDVNRNTARQLKARRFAT